MTNRIEYEIKRATIEDDEFIFAFYDDVTDRNPDMEHGKNAILMMQLFSSESRLKDRIFRKRL